jgi:hypothetical protein
VPGSVGFATKGTLAQPMLNRALTAGVLADWVVAETVYSSEEMGSWLESQHQKYVLAVPETHQVWSRGEPGMDVVGADSTEPLRSQQTGVLPSLGTRPDPTYDLGAGGRLTLDGGRGL